ncbi:protein of unknown function [Candidatus Promineifilum breve]|uniref:Uncharacterized protein n=1 Tax=Candidatus Promineifilum breve TaxID=1806508 RepID=A0A160TA56_9CHLR|nr:hypothetical protein [Candidatus Promineifilum breve]CUS05970.1 protein of unknown function [Candidatus Promineifilum breve]
MNKKRVAERQATNQIYLLRLWREPQDGIWRASLKTTADDQEIAFANLDELFVYLLRQTEAMEQPRRKFPSAQGETVMTTDVVQFTPQDDGLNFVIGHDAIATMTRQGEENVRDEDIEANAQRIINELNKSGLVPGYVGDRLGYAFASALFRRRGDIYNADTGNGVSWLIAWNVFGGLIEIASQAKADLPDLIADITSELADSLLAWKAPMPL